MRSFSKLFSAINFYANFQTQFEIPVDNYVVKNEHAVLLMNRPLWYRMESTDSKAIS